MDSIMQFYMPYDFNNKRVIIRPSIFSTKNQSVLIDAGFENSYRYIENDLYKYDISRVSIKKIVITQHDFEHIGGLYEIKDRFPDIEIMSSKEEAPFISGVQKSPLLIRAEEKFKSSKSDMNKSFWYEYCENMQKIRHVPVDTILKDGQMLDWCYGGIRVMSVPGASVGNIALHFEKYGTMIAGNAISTDGKDIFPPSYRTAYDYSLGKLNFDKLFFTRVTSYLCFHGGIIQRSLCKTRKRLENAAIKEEKEFQKRVEEFLSCNKPLF